MNCRNLILMTMAGLWLAGCVKHQSGPSLGEDALLAQARNYFKDSVLPVKTASGNYPGHIPKVVHWERASSASLPIGQGWFIPIEYSQPLFVRPSFAGERYFSLNSLSQLLIYRDKQQRFHAEVLTWMPDSNFVGAPTGGFSGFLFVEDWWGNRISGYWYDHGQVRKYHEASTQAATIVQVCTVIYGYNYAVGDPGNGYAWVQSGGCYEMYLPDQAGYGAGGGTGGGAGGGGGLSSSSVNISVAPPDNPIANIEDYLKCFTNVGGADHKYTVTVCVDQAVPGTRAPWATIDGGPLGSSKSRNVVDVGHTFLIFTEQYGATTITRNIGFYPSGGVNPIYPSSQGILNNDESHTYNISASFNITSSQFFMMLAYSKRGNDPGFLYNLNTENCTTFALQTLAQGDINLPNTIGYWAHGMGNDPGDLGEDIRGMQLSSNMTRNTVEWYHPNVGKCN